MFRDSNNVEQSFASIADTMNTHKYTVRNDRIRHRTATT